MSAKRILFHGNIPQGTHNAAELEAMSRELGFAIVRHGHVAVLCGPGTLDLIVADAITQHAHQLGVNPDHHLEWIDARSRRTESADIPQLRVGRRMELDSTYAYASFARLRTFVVGYADAIVTIGGEKGVLDVIEKAKLALKPFFPIARTGGESREQWLASRSSQLFFCTQRDFDDLCDLNLSDHELVARIFRNLDKHWRPKPPKAFIVHGHDAAAKYELKNYLQNTLKIPEAIILQEQASSGRTVIEKFEDSASDCNLVFALLTPDDWASSGKSLLSDSSWRARQNAIFELGYFFGRTPRRLGRVLVLHTGRIELPSDLHGLICINIDAGIEAAGEQIRREVIEFLAP